MPIELPIDSALKEMQTLFADDGCDILIIGENHNAIEQRVVLYNLMPQLHDMGFTHLALEDAAHQTPSIKRVAKEDYDPMKHKIRFADQDLTSKHRYLWHVYEDTYHGMKLERVTKAIHDLESSTDYNFLAPIQSAYSKHRLLNQATEQGWSVSGVDTTQWLLTTSDEYWPYAPHELDDLTPRKVDVSYKNGLTARNRIMAERLATLFRDNQGGVVMLDGGLHNFASDLTAKESLQGLLRTQYGLKAKSVNLSSSYTGLTEGFYRSCSRDITDIISNDNKAIKQQFDDAKSIFVPNMPELAVFKDNKPDLILGIPSAIENYKNRYYEDANTSYNPLTEKRVWDKLNKMIVTP